MTAERDSLLSGPSLTGKLAAVRREIRDALADMSTGSAVIETQDGDLGVVFFDEAEAFIVKIEQAGLMVLRDG